MLCNLYLIGGWVFVAAGALDVSLYLIAVMLQLMALDCQSCERAMFVGVEGHVRV